MEIQMLQEITANVVTELERASHSESSSLSFIRNPLSTSSSFQQKKLQVLVIGGSIFKRAVFLVSGNRLHLQSDDERKQPVFHTKDDLFSFCANHIDPSIPSIAINFAYPLKPEERDGKLDGRLITGMKEHSFAGLVGELVGQEFERYLLDKTGNNFHVTIANDTVCLLLSGLSLAKKEELAAAVIGTGVNIAFFSQNGDAINTEAANFDKFSLSDEAKAIDAQSVFPAKALFEKEVAGGYLYHHYNLAIKASHLSTAPIQSTEELDQLAKQDLVEGEIARSILERSAELSACLFAGTALWKKRDLTFVVEGSLFWRGYHYKTIVERIVPQLCKDYTITFIKIENSPLFGGAYLFR